MSADRDDILAFLDRELEIGRFRDYGPIGLQVAGRAERRARRARRLVDARGVRAAEAFGADLLIVHHGLFWDGDSRVVDDLMRRRLETLFRAGITLAAYHLPLDAHRELGNNAQLARVLGVAVEDWFLDDRGAPIALRGRFARAVLRSSRSRARVAARRPVARPLVFPGGPDPVQHDRHLQRRRSARHPRRCGARARRLADRRAERGLPRAGGRARRLVRSRRATTRPRRSGCGRVGRELEQRFGVETSFIDVANPV